MNRAFKSTGLAALVEEMLMLVKESQAFHRAPEIRAILQEAGQILVSIRRRILVSTSRYVVGVVGLTNVGKSTLMNALLGGEVAPRRNGPCTAAPVEFSYGEDIAVTAYLKRGLSRPRWQCSSLDEIRICLEEMADDSGTVVSTTVNRIVVTLPHRLLSNGLVIADTPGFGAAQVECGGTHEESLKAYLTREVSQVFWVVLADQGIGGREKRFYDEFFSEVCDDIVVTGCDEWDDNDCQRFRRRFADRFGNRLPLFHFASGLQGLVARKARDQSGLESAGIIALEERIRRLDDPVSRETALQEQTVQLAQDISWWLNEYRDQNGHTLQRWWRPDSWERFCATASKSCLASELQHSLEQL